MDVVFVSTRQDLANLLQYHLRPIGFEVVLRSDPATLVMEMEEDAPSITLFDAEDFPRHWKPVVMHVRALRPRSEAVILLLARSGLPPEEAAKATHLGVNAIVTEDITDKRGANRLLELLRHYRLLQDKRTFTRYLVTETDRIGMAFIHPSAGTLVTGEVTEISVKGLSLSPDRPERCADLGVGSELPRCSLRIGERIVSVNCQVMRAGRDMGLQFVSFEQLAHDALRTYILERPDRALRAAIEAGRTAGGSPVEAAGETERASQSAEPVA